MTYLQQLVRAGAAPMAVLRCSCQPVSDEAPPRNKRVQTEAAADANLPPSRPLCQRSHVQEAPQRQVMWETELLTGRLAISFRAADKRSHDVVARDVRAFELAVRPMESP